MKHVVTFILAIIMVAGLTRVEAKPVDKATAAHLATRVLNKAVVDATPSQFTAFHLFTGADGHGFVLISADDCARPVLAYSPDGTFDPATVAPSPSMAAVSPETPQQAASPQVAASTTAATPLPSAATRSLVVR